jgi:hypothetical protein
MSRIYHSHVMNTILSDKTRQIHVRIFPHKAQISSHFPRNTFFLTCYLSRLTHNGARKAKRSQMWVAKFVNRSSNYKPVENSSIVPQITNLSKISQIVPQNTNLSKIRQSFLNLQTCRKFVNRSSNYKLFENSSIVPQNTNLSKIRQSFLKIQTCGKFANRSSNYKLVENSSVVSQITNLPKSST